MNIKKLKMNTVYSHDIMNCTSRDLTGNYLYSGRALGITEAEDIICLHPLLKENIEEVLNHYKRIGLTCSEKILWTPGIPSLKGYPGYTYSPFFYDRKAHNLAPSLQRLKVTEFINNKNNFIQLAKALEIPVPQTRCYTGPEEVKDSISWPCYLKAAVSSGGKGIFRCRNREELNLFLSCYPPGSPVQVQEEIRGTDFLNIQYRADNEGFYPLEITEQILENNTHTGNSCPSVHRPWGVTDKMAQWLWKQGLRGIFAFDVAVTEEEGKKHYLPLECNPRYNGATYPTLIAKKLGIKSWTSVILKCGYNSIQDLPLKEYEYNCQSESGIILVNWGTVTAGKLGVLAAGPQEKREEILKNFSHMTASPVPEPML